MYICLCISQGDGLHEDLCPPSGNSTSSVLTDASLTLTNISLLNHEDVEVPLLNTRCQEQKIRLLLPYTVIVVVFGVTALPIGLFFDRFGLRTTRTIAV